MRKPISIVCLCIGILCLLSFGDKTSHLFIQGKVVSQDGSALPNVEVILEGGEIFEKLNTDEKGRFSFQNLPEFNDYIVKTNNSGSGISSLRTLLKINQYLYDLYQFDNSYDFLLSDIDESKEINYLDMDMIRTRLLNDRLERKNLSIFKEGLEVLTNNQLENADFSYQYSNLNRSIHEANFIAFTKNELKSINDSHQLNLKLKDKKLIKGESFSVPIYAENYIHLIGSLIELNIDASKLNLISVKSEGLASDKYYFKTSNEHTNQKLRLLEYSTRAKTLVSKPIFLLEFEAINTGMLSEAIHINENGEAFDAKLNQYDINLEFEKTSRIKESEETGVILYQNSPNPFNDLTFVKFEIGTRENIDWQLVDNTGKIVWKHSQVYEPGDHELTLDNSHFKSGGGVYSLHFRTKEELFTKSLFCLK